ncbi:MAG: D-aminoacylase [Rhodospirillales bacterium]|nr:D-aminoacylase [Rhodospirillales bacterium]
MIKPLLALCATLLATAASAQDYDLVLRNAKILDGAGNPWVRGDVAIKGDRIARIGVVPGKGAREIDAAGRYVAPGFIDMMDQSGSVLRKNGAAENKLRMGVTTVIAGEGGIPVDADHAVEYFALLESQGIGVNFGSYFSAAQARVKVMGDGAGTPTAVQMELMKREVETAMRAGTFGISTALIYPPNSFQSTEDLIELAKVASRCDGFYSTHMRDESAKLVEAVEEAIAIGEKGGVKVEIFHMKAAYAPQFGKLMPKAVAAIAAARQRGVDVAADLYPYTAGGTGLSITIPNWVFEKGAAAGVELLKDPKVRARVKREVAAGSQPGWSNLVEASGGWSHVVLANPYNEKYERYSGKSIADIAKALGQDPVDVAIDITVEALPHRAMALFFMMDERDIATALRQSWTSIGSDAAASEGAGKTDALGLPHPRAYGTFPRVLAEYVKKRHVLTLEDAVRKMTSWPASRMGLEGRGVLREGLYADLVMFDLDRIDDKASYADPTARPAGIDLVVVNGAVAIENGVASGARAGHVLRHSCKAA